MKRRLAVFALIAGLILSSASPGFAAGGFTDVGEKYWALPYIGLARETRLIEGYVKADGSAEFRPENNVTKQECLVMLLNTLKLAGGVSDEDFTSEFEFFFSDYEPPKSGAPQGIPGWARPYVAYALKNGICVEEDFTLPSNDTERSGGYSYASRELIALWTCRIMGYETSSFLEPVCEDWQQAGFEYLPAIDALYRHGIMQGNKGYFYPQNGVKRSEMAAVCMRLLGVKANEEKGTITDRGIIGEDGEVRPGAVLYDMDKYLKSLSQKDRGLELSCRIVGADRISQTVTLLDGEKERTFFYGEDLSLDADGKALSIEEIADFAGEDVLLCVVKYSAKTLVIQRIPIVRSGVVTGIDDMGLYKIVTVELENGEETSWFITDKSQTKGKIKEEKSVSFIADGSLILEMR